MLQGPRASSVRAVQLEAALDESAVVRDAVSVPRLAHRARCQGSDPKPGEEAKTAQIAASCTDATAASEL
jgi:hypothetical protein